MLENRPTTKRVLAGIGGFAFVFTAAMAGTGMMMTGGVIHDPYLGGDVERIAPTQAVDPITVMYADWEPGENSYSYAPTPYGDQYASAQTVGYTFEDAAAVHQAAAMRAEARGDGEAVARHTRSQAAIERDIERLYQETYLNPRQAESTPRMNVTAEPQLEVGAPQSQLQIEQPAEADEDTLFEDEDFSDVETKKA